MKPLTQICFLFILSICLSSCIKEDSPQISSENKDANLVQRRTILTDCTPKNLEDEEELIIRLIAGQNMVAGTVTLEQNGSDYLVCYNTNSDWLLTEIHLYVGDKDGVPLNKQGQPIPGHFPINTTLATASNSACFDISDLEDDFCGVIVAHAVVSGKKGRETAWAEGCLFTNKNWSMYVDFCL